MISRPSFEVLIIVLPYLPAPSLNLVTNLELSVQKRCKDLRWEVAGANVYPGVFVYLTTEKLAAISAFLANDLGALHIPRVVDQQRASFATGKILGLVKA